MEEEKRKKVVLAKPGLDGHDVGVKIVARALRDAGHEVVYLGLFQSPSQIVRGAIQEDADIIGLSILCGGHKAIISRLMDLIGNNKLDRVKVVVGGVIPDKLIPELKEMGVQGIFPTGTSIKDIVSCVETI